MSKMENHQEEKELPQDEQEMQDPAGAPQQEEPAQTKAADQPQADELEKLQKKYDELNDRYLRTLAEYDNFRKRSLREKEAVYPGAVADTVSKFLPVVDSFERALACECADVEFKKGIDMIFDSLGKTLEALSVTEIGEVGETFDANMHNAVMHIEDENLGQNVVSAVLQKGYRIGDRVLRYAMVTVAN